MQKHPSTDHGDSMLMKGTFPFFRFVCHKQLGCGAFSICLILPVDETSYSISRNWKKTRHCGTVHRNTLRFIFRDCGMFLLQICNVL